MVLLARPIFVKMIPLARVKTTSSMPSVGIFKTKIAKCSQSLDQNHQNFGFLSKNHQNFVCLFVLFSIYFEGACQDF